MRSIHLAPRLKSLRGRLFAGLSVTILAFWFVLLFPVKWLVNGPTHPAWDTPIRQLGTSILSSAPKNVAVGADPDTLGRQLEATIAAAETLDATAASFQIWLDRHLIFRSKNAPAVPLKPDFRKGFADQTLGDQVWRVYDTSDDTGRIHVQVGKSPQQRRDDLAHLASIWFAQTALLLGLPMLAIWRVIRWSFTPVDAIRDLMQRRRPFDLTPLPHENIPSEVRTLVESFNRMLQQVDHAVQAERRFISDAAHELRTPLAVLAALAQVALRAGTLEEKDDLLRRLSAGVERSARLSEQLLDLARVDAGANVAEHKPLDVSSLVAMVIQDFEGAARQRDQLITLQTEPTWTLGDLDEIAILVRNLLDNALRYSGVASHVSVSCHYTTRDRVECVKLTVADNGPGVPPESRERIFDRFFRIPGNAQPGSGIGLSLVAGIAKAHEAHIEVEESEAGRGFRVSVYFRRFLIDQD